MAALEDWDAEAVVAWLSSLQLERYAPAFRKYRVDGRRLALGLSEKFMSAQLRINVRLHRLKIQQSSSELRAAARRRGGSGGGDLGEGDGNGGRVVGGGGGRRRRQNRKDKGDRRAGSNSVVSSPHLRRRRAPRDVTSAPAKIRPRNRRPRNQPNKDEGKQTTLHRPEITAPQRDSRPPAIAIAAYDYQANSDRLSSPVSSLRAKQTQGRYLGRRLGSRSGLLGSPRSRSGSPLSLRSNSTGSVSSGSERSRASHGSGAAATNAVVATATATAGSTEPGGGGRAAADNVSPSTPSPTGSGMTTSWRPFSAPIGLATRQHRRRNSRSSQCDEDPLLTNRSHVSRGSSAGGGYTSSSSNGSRGSLPPSSTRRSRPLSFETAWTWKQLLESSDLEIFDWLSRVAHSVNHGRDESGDWAEEVRCASRVMRSEGYMTVRDLLEDVYEADFRSDLQQWGLRKRFLNEVHHRLKDMAHAFEVLAERPSPTASASKDVGAHPSFAASNTTSSSSSPSVAAPQRSDSPRTRKTFAANTDVGKRADDLPFHIVGRDNKRRDKLKRPSGLSIMPLPRQDATRIVEGGLSMLRRRNTHAEVTSRGVAGIPPVECKSGDSQNPVAVAKVSTFQDGSNPRTTPSEKKKEAPRVRRKNPSININDILRDSDDAYGGSASMVMTPGGTVKYDGFTIAAQGVRRVPMNDVRVSWSQSVGDGDAVAAVSAARGARGGTDASAETNQQLQEEEQRRRQRQHNESPLRNRNKSDKKAKDSAIGSPSGQSIEDELIVLHKLGAGAGGVVHKAVHVPTMTMVAVKRIRLFDRSELRQMSKELKALYTCSAAVGGHSSRRSRGSSFARDTEISGSPSADGTMGDGRRHADRSLSPLGQGECPHVVSYYDAFTSRTDATISIVLEFMDAGSLQDLINASVPMAECVVVNIGYRILKGLEFIHSRRIIHRDIKPSNLLINRRGDVKISDFGIARKLQGTGALSQTYLGTLMYMAPERINTNEYGKPADIWAVGLSLLTCAMGRFPFENKSGYWALTHAIAIADLPDLSHLEEERGFTGAFRDFIYQCLNKDPEGRPSATQLLDHEIFKQHGCEENMAQGGEVGGGRGRNDQKKELTESYDLEGSRASSLCQSLSESMIMARSINGSFEAGGVSASSERIEELDMIAGKVIRYQQRLHLEPGGPHGFREWGDPAAVEKLYLPPQRLKRLARQLGLPSHVVIRKFDKKAAQLMGVGTALSLRVSGSSGGSGMSSAGSAVWESVEGNLEPELPFHMAGDETPRNPLKKPAGLRVETKF